MPGEDPARLTMRTIVKWILLAAFVVVVAVVLYRIANP